MLYISKFKYLRNVQLYFIFKVCIKLHTFKLNDYININVLFYLLNSILYI